MKRLVFKKWVNWLILGIMLLCCLVMAGECESTVMFILTKLGAMVIFGLSGYLYFKFGRKEIL